ncbi:MAG: ABC transporter permease [Acidobacteriaceae bacterium]|nr:ABC transporter permease [Acidobacteriaceae bacterium]
MMGEIWRRLGFLFHRSRFEQDLEEEMCFHAEMAGRARFGNFTLLGEDSRSQWGFGALERLAHDLRFAIRMLRKSPAFTAVAVLSLTLGIGANTAIFSVINAVILRSLAVRNPEQLVALNHSDFRNTPSRSFPYPFYRELRDHNDIFSGILCQTGFDSSLSVKGDAQRVTGEMVSANYFTVLGLQPYAGRLFRPDDETSAGANRVVVLSYNFWRRRFGGDGSIIGRVVDLNTTPMTVIGVAPPEFDSLRTGFNPDVRVPITMQPQMYLSDSMLDNREDWWLYVVARLKPGVTRQRAEATLTARLRRYRKQSNNGQPISEFRRRMFESTRVNLLLAGTGLATQAERGAKQLWILMAVVAIVLLSGCLNIANLLLARTAARRREFAVRLSLGAPRRRLIRQLLTESILLAFAGGACGIAFAIAGARLLTMFLTAGQNGVSIDVTPGARVLAFTLVLSLLTGILFGVAPAFQGTQVELTPELKGEQLRFPGTRIPWRKALVSVQVALSVLLLIGAGLFLRSLIRLRTMDLGFDQKNVLQATVGPTLIGYGQQQVLTFYRELGDRVARIPGVLSVSFSSIGLVSDSDWGSGITVQGYQPKEDDVGPDRNIVGPGYFSTLHIPIIEGRDFTERDHARSPHVAIVNEIFARFYFGNQNPIGKLIGPGGKGQVLDFAIVGVAKDGKYANLREEPQRFWYIPYEQYAETQDLHDLTLYARTTGDPMKETGAIRRVVRSLDPKVPVYNVKTLEEQIDQDLASDRMVATLSSFFSLLTALIAAIGLYGVMTFSMTQRTREIGIRMALGAQRSSVVNSVMREVTMLIALGIAVGVPCALGLGRFVKSILFEIKPTDQFVFITAIVLAVVVTLTAGYLPARRAASIDPTLALRYE